jgi:replication factor C small subunit
MRWIEKYRPVTFSQCIGNKEVFQQIEGLTLTPDIPHFLLYGPSGTGKTTAARIITSIISDEGNLTEINASSDRGIDIMRSVVMSAIRNRTFDGKPRIILLDESDGLTKEAQELLRKPLESASNTVFIFCLNEIGRINMAILSRCAVFKFNPISRSEMLGRLREICTAEHIDIDDKTLEKVTEISQGDLRTAINELQKVTAESDREEEITKVLNQYLEKAKT